MGSHCGVGEFTTHFSFPILEGIGMFTGGMIWILTHGQIFALDNMEIVLNNDMPIALPEVLANLFTRFTKTYDAPCILHTLENG